MNPKKNSSSVSDWCWNRRIGERSAGRWSFPAREVLLFCSDLCFLIDSDIINDIFCRENGLVNLSSERASDCQIQQQEMRSAERVERSSYTAPCGAYSTVSTTPEPSVVTSRPSR